MSEILLAIVGSRNYTNYSSFAQIVETWVKEPALLIPVLKPV